jgi:taurine dioxygenase
VTYEIKPLSGPLGAEIVGLDLKAAMPDDTTAAVNRALADHIVLVFRKQDLSAPQFLAAAERFGEPLIQHLSQYQAPDCPMVSYVSNQEKTEAGAPKLLGKAWHTDHSFQPEPPKTTMLHGVELPKQGGDTWFANMRLAYDELPGALKDRIDGLEAIHAYRESREVMSRDEREAEMLTDEEERANGVVHPVARTHDERGSRAIYINPLRIKRFIGMGADESTDLLAELTAHATSDAFTYAHAWRQGDVVLWDNRQVLHRVEHNYDLAEKRLMHRIILKGAAPR